MRNWQDIWIELVRELGMGGKEEEADDMGRERGKKIKVLKRKLDKTKKQERVSFIGAKLRAKEQHLMKEQAKSHRQTDWHDYRREQGEFRLQFTYVK